MKTAARLISLTLLVLAAGCADESSSLLQQDAGPRFPTVWISNPHHLQGNLSSVAGMEAATIRAENWGPRGDVLTAVRSAARFETYETRQPVPGVWRQAPNSVGSFGFVPEAKLAEGDYVVRLEDLAPDIVIPGVKRRYVVFRIGSVFRLIELELYSLDSTARTFAAIALMFTQPADNKTAAIEVQYRSAAPGSTWQTMPTTFTVVPQPAKTRDHFRFAQPISIDDTVRIKVLTARSQTGTPMDTSVKVGVPGAAPGALTIEFVPGKDAYLNDILYTYSPPVYDLE